MGAVHKKTKWRPFLLYSNGWAVRNSNGIRKQDHLPSNLFSNIQNPDQFRFQIPTVVHFTPSTFMSFQILGDDTQACIVLPDATSSDVEGLIASSINDDALISVDIDASFADKFYWCDVGKLTSKNDDILSKSVEFVTSDRHKVNRSGEESLPHKISRKRYFIVYFDNVQKWKFKSTT